MRLFSPSKVNLNLKILSERDDGYHEVKTVMQTISLGDLVSVELLDSEDVTRDVLTCSNPSIPIDCSNLVIKALDLFRSATKRSCSFKVHLDKRVPVGAGLGGGSSNAATVIFAASQLSGTLDSSMLQSVAESTGCDVPFFLMTQTGKAECTGRGEIVFDLAEDPLYFVLVTFPTIDCVTRKVFAAHDTLPGNDAFSRLNDLEHAAMNAYPELRGLRDKLDKIHSGFHLSGSGSAHFTKVGTEVEATHLVQLVEEMIPDSKCYLVHTLSKARESGWF